MSSLFSAKPNPKKKGDKNATSEPAASKFVPPSRKGDENCSPSFDVDKESPDYYPNKYQGIFEFTKDMLNSILT